MLAAWIETAEVYVPNFAVIERALRRRWAMSTLTGLLAVAAGCSKPPPEQEVSPPSVVTQSVTTLSWSTPITLTGEIKARIQSDLAFRFAGRLASRDADVGDHVEAGQILARLETDQQEADLNVAKAGVDAAEATLRQASSNLDRQAALLKKGYTTQSKFDDAQQAATSALASLDSAKASLATAQDALDDATLRAGQSGIITARTAEVGQIVNAAQPVFTLAQDGSRDAVFEAYEALLARPPANNTVEITLLSNQRVKAIGRVREVAPAVDQTTGTVRVKLSIEDTPPEMGLGAPVVGTARFHTRDVVALPWTAFFTDAGAPAVWVVDAKTSAVSLRRVAIDSYSNDRILLSDGLKVGEVVVTRGTQLLRPGEVVTPQPQSAPAPANAT